MNGSILTASPARRDEWRRVRDLLPWQDAPAWAPFAFRHCGRWFWAEKPPVSVVHDSIEVSGRVSEFQTAPDIVTDESLFLRPRAHREGRAQV